MNEINSNGTYPNYAKDNVEEPLKIDFSQIIVPESHKEPVGAGNVFANTEAVAKPTSCELKKIVQKLEKLEKMINPNSKKSMILWEEDNSFKNLISSIVNYSCTCDTDEEFPIELFDRLKALGTDVDSQITEGATKVADLQVQQKHNLALGELLSSAYISATAGLPIEQIEATLTDPDIQGYKEQLSLILNNAPDSEEYKNAEKSIKSKINNLENNVHITIDLERTTSKASALEYIKREVTPAISRLQTAYDTKYNAQVATQIDGEEAITSLAVKKSLSEKIYDTFVRPFANLFKRKKKVQ